MADDELLGQQRLAMGRVLELTDLMLQRAKLSHWDAVGELQGLRDRLIHQFFAEQPVLEDRRLGEEIRSIIETDREIAALVGAERNALQDQIRKMKHGRSAVKAYAGG